MCRLGEVQFKLCVSPPEDLDGLSPSRLKELVVELLGEVADLKRLVAAQRDEIARLKGLKGRPSIRSSGMEKGSEPKPGGKQSKHRRRGKVTPRVRPEIEVLQVAHPPGSQFKGHEPYQVQDLVLTARVVRYCRERWLTPDGVTIVAPLPGGIRGHFGPELRRFVLMQHHQGQVTAERLVTLLQAVGVCISKRQVIRLLIDGQDDFLMETREVLRAGLETADWITVDDTGARHRGANGVCTQIGNDNFAWFGTTGSKSRLNFLGLLRAGYIDYVINDAALDYMRDHAMAGALVQRLATHEQRQFADDRAWLDHLEQLGLVGLQVTPDPVRVATEGALWGAVSAHGFLCEAVVVSDDAGQFNIGQHALCCVVRHDGQQESPELPRPATCRLHRLRDQRRRLGLHARPCPPLSQGQAMAGALVQRLATHEQRQFADDRAWLDHLEQLGLVGLQVTPDPVRVATEGALWGAVSAHGFLCEAVVVSDDAGQFNIGQHALCCWCGRPPTASMCQNEVV